MKVLIVDWNGTCAECGKEIATEYEVYFCSQECAEKYREWIRDNIIAQ